jgi:FecR protein
MISRTVFRSTFLVLFAFLFAGVLPALADVGHARIIRLSLVQGDVRVARDFHGDPLTDANVPWEAAQLNLPIRQGYIIATGDGRAEVEFENGAMAFLAENTILQFYDLSLEDAAKTTRLVLRQGTGAFYVNPSQADYFSVTSGDFTVEAVGRTTFRVNDFDDGSTVNVLKGHVSVLRKEKTSPLARGQSFSMQAGNDNSANIAQAPSDDEFDRWVSSHIDSVVTATSAAQQYVNSPNYTSGLADLYTYGAFYPISGYGNCWRPYGVGLGWSPFNSGGWFMDPLYGGAFIGSQPWGWLPYHYGGWIFDPVFGWMWAPGGLGFGGLGFITAGSPWRPVTGVWVHSKPGLVGIVPVHPFDAHGKAPINLARGVFPVTNGAISAAIPVNSGEEWKVVKNVPAGTLHVTSVATTPPARVSSTLVSGSQGTRAIVLDHNSSIAYDPVEHRFVNTNSAPAPTAKTEDNRAEVQTGAANRQAAAIAPAVPNAAAKQRAAAPPARMTTPPQPSRFAEAARARSYEGGGSAFEGSRSSSSASHAAASSSTASHAAAAPSSSGGGAHPH